MTRAALTGLVGLMSVMVSYGITNEMTLFDRTCYHSCLLCLLLSRPFGFNVSPGFSLYICSLFLSSYLDLLFYSVSVTVTVVAVSILPVFHLNIIHLFISALVPVFQPICLLLGSFFLLIRVSTPSFASGPFVL